MTLPELEELCRRECRRLFCGRLPEPPPAIERCDGRPLVLEADEEALRRLVVHALAHAASGRAHDGPFLEQLQRLADEHGEHWAAVEVDGHAPAAEEDLRRRSPPGWKELCELAEEDEISSRFPRGWEERLEQRTGRSFDELERGIPGLRFWYAWLRRDYREMLIKTQGW